MTTNAAQQKDSASTALGSRFWRVFASSATSNLADGIGRTAIPLLAAGLTRSPVEISALGALAYLPWLLLALPSGALVDRLDRRLCMLYSNMVRAIVMGGTAVLAGTGQATMPVLYVCVLLLGVAETVYDSAARAMLPQVVVQSRLDSGNSLLTAEETVGQLFVGAPVGSMLFVLAAWLPLGSNAIGFAVAAALIGTLRGPFRAERDRHNSLRSDMVDGTRWLYRHRLLRGICVISGLTGLLQAMPNAIVVLFALQILHISAGQFGLLLVAGGVGGVAGGLLAPKLAAWFGRITCLVGSAILGPLAMGLVGLANNGWTAGTLFAVSAGSVTVWNVLSMSLRQALIPEELFGRVQGAYRTVIWGAIPVGSLAGGALASLTSLRVVFYVAGVGQALVGVWMWRLLRSHRALVESVGQPATENHAPAALKTEPSSPGRTELVNESD